MKRCDPRDIAIKSFFLGPQAENGPWLKALVNRILDRWFNWRQNCFPTDGRAISTSDLVEPHFKIQQNIFWNEVEALLTRYEREIPKFSPRYFGHMFSEVSMPALMGHLVCLLHNPNILAKESAKMGVEIEREAIAALASMIGFDPSLARGHFTSGGTLANFEALLRAKIRKKSPAPAVLVPASRHYSWDKAIQIFGLPKESLVLLELDAVGHIDLAYLKEKLELLKSQDREILMVVSVCGTTELGSIDPIEGVDLLLKEYSKLWKVHLWHHVDAAFGGYFCSLLRPIESGQETKLTPETTVNLLAISKADSVTLDPHKLGYVPYSCGAFLVRSAELYPLIEIDAPYLDIQKDQDPGQFTIEGSRSGSGASATWLTARAIGFNQEGYGRIIGRTIQLRKLFEQKLENLKPQVVILSCSETNILTLLIQKPKSTLGVPSVAENNLWTDKLCAELGPSGVGEFFVSKTTLRGGAYSALIKSLLTHTEFSPIGSEPTPDLRVMRVVIMNPFINSKEMNISIIDEFITTLKAKLIHP